MTPRPQENQLDGTYFSDLLKITKGAGINFGGTLSGKALLFFYTIFIAKVLGAKALGVYFLGITIIGLLTILCSLGLDTGVVRFVAIYSGRNDLSRMKGTVLLSSAISILSSVFVACIIFLFSDVISIYIFHKPELGNVIKLLSLSIPFISLKKVFLASTQGLKFMQYTAYTENVFDISLRFLFTLLFLYGLKLRLRGVVLAYVASCMFSAGLAFYYAKKLVPLLDKKIAAVFEIRNLLRFAIPMVSSRLIFNLMRNVDVLMLGLFVSAPGVGIYSVIVRITTLALAISGAFLPIFNPFIADLHYKKEFEKLSDLLKTITRWIIMINFPIFLCLIFFPMFFLNIFGKEFIEGSTCLSILAIALLFDSTAALPNCIIFMSGRSDIMLKNSITILITNIILNYLLIPRYGISGAALATSISLVLLAIIRIIEVYYLVKIQPFRIDIWKPLTSGLISLIVILVLHRNFLIKGNAMMIALFSIFFLLYFSLLYFFKLSKEDFYIKRALNNKLTSLIK